jgi:hypothetical protein
MCVLVALEHNRDTPKKLKEKIKKTKENLGSPGEQL